MAIDSNDAGQVEFTAHKVKGSAGQLNAASMSDIAFQLETMGKDSRLLKAEKQCATLTNIFKEFKEVRAGLETEIQ